MGRHTDLLRKRASWLYAVVSDWGRQRLEKRAMPWKRPPKNHGVTVVQLALAWLLHRSPVMLPIPGTSSVAHLEENVAAEKLKLTPEEWKAIDALAG